MAAKQRARDTDGHPTVTARDRPWGRRRIHPLDQAADDLADRISRRIMEAADLWSPRKWPEDGAPSPRVVPLRTGGPVLPTRIKRVRLDVCPPETAASVMDLMDYRVHLFVDSRTGMDAVVYRAGPTGYRLARLRPAPPPVPNSIPVAVDPRPAVPLPVERAVARLEETGLGHLFFADPRTGRGRLLYRRYDSGYALLEDAR